MCSPTGLRALPNIYESGPGSEAGPFLIQLILGEEFWLRLLILSPIEEGAYVFD